MKKSIAKAIIFRIISISLCIMIFVCVELYFFLRDITLEEVKTDGIAFVSQFANTVKLCWTDDGYLSEEKADLLEKELQSLCNISKADYMYVYIPDIENNRIIHVLTAYGEQTPAAYKDMEIPEIVENYTFSEQEIAIWNGTEDFAFTGMDNPYGKEYTTLMGLDNDNGNRIAIVGVDFSYKAVHEKIDLNFMYLRAGGIVLITIFNVLLYRVIRKRIIKPAKEISEGMKNFTNNDKKTKINVNERYDDEFALMARSFNDMADDIDEYINDIKLLTEEQAQQKAELEIAANVQKGLLPKDSLDTDTYIINAMMRPAKNVGGDLYDYFKVDDDNTLLVIADVSGKGLSAAMFMSVTLTLIRQFAKMVFSPSDILNHVNSSLNENNPQMLFATAFIGIYDNKNKILTYSNAGHNLPYILRNKALIPLDKSKGVPLGMFDNESYNQCSAELQRGDIIYMYTDGVNEAVNDQNEFFGTKRLENQLKKYNAFLHKNVISHIDNSLKEFSKGAMQYDDITMLTLCIHDKIILELNADKDEFTKIKDEILKSSIPKKLKLKMCLAAEEIFVNICSYAYSDKPAENEKINFLLIVSDQIIMQFTDSGKEYNPLNEILDINTYDVDTQVGGLGKFITFSVADDVNYKYENNKNILTIVKYIKEDKDGYQKN